MLRNFHLRRFCPPVEQPHRVVCARHLAATAAAAAAAAARIYGGKHTLTPRRDIANDVAVAVAAELA